MIYVVASDDAFHLGVLSSRVHQTWCKYAGGTLQDRPRYNSNRTFFPFPFPTNVLKEVEDDIRQEAEALDALRKKVIEANQDLTLTKLYNVLEALRQGQVLTDAERAVHDKGLVTLLRQHHDAIDGLVLKAYGWPENLSDEEILTNIVKLPAAEVDGVSALDDDPVCISPSMIERLELVLPCTTRLVMSGTMGMSGVAMLARSLSR